ncbi:MAG: PhoU domain-containing protein [Sulfolobales archaeon]
MGRLLCVETERDEKREAVIDLDYTLDADLKYVLISLYVLGFDRARLSSKKKISSTMRRHRVSLLNYAPGYEIVEEGENFVDVAIAREVEDPIKALSREFNSVFTLFKYAIEALERAPSVPDENVDAVEELDDEVDRAWFEVERTVYKSIGRTYLRSAESRSLIPLLLVSRCLERLSDHIVQLVQEAHASPIQQYGIIAQIRSLLLSYHDIVELFKEVLEKRESTRDTNIVTKLINIIENKKSYKHGVIPRLRKEGGILIAYHVMRIYDCITDIAEVVTNVILDSPYSKI